MERDANRRNRWTGLVLAATLLTVAVLPAPAAADVGCDGAVTHGDAYLPGDAPGRVPVPVDVALCYEGRLDTGDDVDRYMFAPPKATASAVVWIHSGCATVTWSAQPSIGETTKRWCARPWGKGLTYLIPQVASLTFEEGPAEYAFMEWT